MQARRGYYKSIMHAKQASKQNCMLGRRAPGCKGAPLQAGARHAGQVCFFMQSSMQAGLTGIAQEMRARLHDGDAVGGTDRGQPVRDNNSGAASHAARERVLHQPLALRVQRASRLIRQHKQCCLIRRHARCRRLPRPSTGSISTPWQGMRQRCLVHWQPALMPGEPQSQQQAGDRQKGQIRQGETSSRSRMRGSLMSARAMATRCFCPPLSWMPPSPSCAPDQATLAQLSQTVNSRTRMHAVMRTIPTCTHACMRTHLTCMQATCKA
jgi:hypothetical protein